jgi:hypothetical protein
MREIVPMGTSLFTRFRFDCVQFKPKPRILFSLGPQDSFLPSLEELPTFNHREWENEQRQADLEEHQENFNFL